MKKRYILLGLLVADIVLVDLHIEEHHDVTFDSSTDQSIVELHNYGNERSVSGRKYLIRRQIDQPPYFIVSDIVLNGPEKMKSISARNNDEELFSTTYDQFKALTDDVIFEDLTRKIFLSYADYYHEDGYYNLQFSRVYFTADNPLKITVSYLDDDGNEVIEDVTTEIKLRHRWSSFTFDGMMGV